MAAIPSRLFVSSSTTQTVLLMGGSLDDSFGQPCRLRLSGGSFLRGGNTRLPDELFLGLPNRFGSPFAPATPVLGNFFLVGEWANDSLQAPTRRVK
jgi:hypothetical protein